MLKKSVTLLMACFVLITTLISCSKKEHNNLSSMSSIGVASDETSSTQQIPEWNDDDTPANIIRPSFMSVDEIGNIFYCGEDGAVYKQLADKKGLSKVYSSTEYKFMSVQCIEQSKICVGYKGKNNQSGYIIFNLKDKTISNAVNGEEYASTDIHSLIHYNNAVYFLSSPDRYNRYSLYMQKDKQITKLAHGVNEFFILKDRVFYNIGSSIYSVNISGKENQLIQDLPTNDLLGFSIVGKDFVYMTAEDTFRLPVFTNNSKLISSQLNVYTQATDESYAFFCGTNGGIYYYSFETEKFYRFSDYSSSNLMVYDDYLYLFPTSKDIYPNVDESYIINGGIHRISISKVFEYINSQKENSTSSVFAVPEGNISSNITEAETEPPKPEKFGR